MNGLKKFFIYITMAIIGAFLTLFGNDLYNAVFPKKILEYEITSHSYLNNFEIYSIKLYNFGKETQNNIKIYFPIHKNGKIFVNEEIETNVDEKKEYDEIYYVNIDKKKSTTIEKNEKYKILKIKSLRISEVIDIKVLHINSYNISSYSHSLSNIKVESDSTLGSDATEKPFLKFLYKYGFFLLSFLFISLYIIGLIINLSPVEHKIKFVENQIRKNEKELEKLKKIKNDKSPNEKGSEKKE
jgi:hypothetical protein